MLCIPDPRQATDAGILRDVDGLPQARHHELSVLMLGLGSDQERARTDVTRNVRLQKWLDSPPRFLYVAGLHQEAGTRERPAYARRFVVRRR